MTGKSAARPEIEFRSLGEQEIQLVHRYQNLSCTMELSDMLDFEPPYLPLPIEKVKAKLEEMSKKDRTYLFGVWSKDNQFVGLGLFSAEFDPWSPWMGVFMWPEHRRKGYGSAAAAKLLERAFGDTVAHVVSSYAPGWNESAQRFAESVGFKRAGGRRRSYFIDGKYYDGVFYDVLRKEHDKLARKGGEP